MKRLLLAVALLLVGAHAHAQTSEVEIQADLLAVEIAAAVEAERFTDAAKLLDDYANLGVPMPLPLILQRAVVYTKLGWFLDAEAQLKDYLKKSERGSEEYKHAVLMLAEVKPKAKAEAKRVAAEEKAAAQRVGESFRDCPECPEMVIIRAGSFTMGSPYYNGEGPQHRVTVGEYAVGKYEVTFAEWEACRRAGGCSRNPEDWGWGKGNRPVIEVSWTNAKEYVKWLSKKTDKRYRLLSESEWEDAARAGTTTPYHTGRAISSSQANYNGNHGKTVAVGSYPANQFGLHDMHGNVYEWVEDCWHNNYRGAPNNGSAWATGGDCALRVLRGGSWFHEPRLLRAANRLGFDSADRYNDVGFRVARAARTLTP